MEAEDCAFFCLGKMRSGERGCGAGNGKCGAKSVKMREDVRSVVYGVRSVACRMESAQWCRMLGEARGVGIASAGCVGSTVESALVSSECPQ